MFRSEGEECNVKCVLLFWELINEITYTDYRINAILTSSGLVENVCNAILSLCSYNTGKIGKMYF